jgi:RNA polymerase sigma-70 factor, ECF subfamily
LSLLHFFGRTRQLEEKLKESRARLCRLAHSWCHHRALADDLVQEALAKAVTHHDQLRDPASLHAWLCSILANCWHDHLRARKDTTDIDTVAEHELQDGGLSPEEDCLQNEIVLRVRRAVAELPSGQREVVTLVDLEEFSYADVAAILDIPMGTVMSRLSRARLALKEKLAEPAVSASVHKLAMVK